MVFALLISGITMGAIYGLIGMGYLAIFNSSGVINFAQGDYVMLGGLISAFLLHNAGVSYQWAVLIALLCTTAYGVLTGVLIVYPLRKASILMLVIATLGISIFTQNTASLILGRQPLSLPTIIDGAGIYIFGNKMASANIIVLSGAAIILFVLYLTTKMTLLGKSMQACSTDRLAARLVGISSNTVILVSFGISAAVGAIGGILITPVFFTSYSIGTLLGLKGFVAAVIGGWGKTHGAFVGGLILGVIESFAAGFVSSTYRDAVAFIVLIVVLYVFPRGLFHSDVTD